MIVTPIFSTAMLDQLRPVRTQESILYAKLCDSYVLPVPLSLPFIGLSNLLICLFLASFTLVQTFILGFEPYYDGLRTFAICLPTPNRHTFSLTPERRTGERRIGVPNEIDLTSYRPSPNIISTCKGYKIVNKRSNSVIVLCSN